MGWGFDKNTSRKNVRPTGQSFVASDTLGLIAKRGSNILIITRSTKGHPHMVRLIAQWVQGRLPEQTRKDPIPFTSVSLNAGYAAKRHRDRNNIGPSVTASLGEFSGGKLFYWPLDDKKTPLDLYQLDDCIVLDTKQQAAIFDGNLCHEVEAFIGERYSVVLFTVKTSEVRVKTMLLKFTASWNLQEVLTL